MPRWIWITIAFCVSTSVYFTIRYGLRPKPVPVMNPTQFEGPEQIGVVVYKRLRQNVRADMLVLLGASNGAQDEDAKVWDGFEKAAAADGENVFPMKTSDYPDKESLFKTADEALKARKLVIIRGLTPEVSHFAENSLSRQLDSQRKHPVLSISIQRLAINKADADDLQTQCLDTESESGHRKLDCAAQKVARKYLKRKLEADKLWAVVERHGLKEYLVFIHRP